MRTPSLVPAIGLVAALIAAPPAASQDQAEWVDLLGHDLKDWTGWGPARARGG